MQAGWWILRRVADAACGLSRRTELPLVSRRGEISNLFLVLGMSLATAACTSGGGASAVHSAAPSTSAASSAAASPSISPNPPPVVPAPAHVSQAPVAPSVSGTACTTAGLAMTDDGGQGAAGTYLGIVVLRNIGAQPCTMYGYAGLQRVGSSGQLLPTQVSRQPNPAPSTVTLAPQAKASFVYRYVDRNADGSACSKATKIEVTPPNQDTHQSLRPDSEGFEACGSGEVDVFPVVSGVQNPNQVISD